MSGKTKNILIGVLIVGLVSMTVVYAALSQTLNINGSAQLQNKTASWNVHFANIQGSGAKVVPSAYASSASNSLTFDGTSTTVTLPEVTFNAPGATITYYFDVVNDGDITASLQTINPVVVPAGSFGAGETLSESVQNTYKSSGITGTLTLANGNALNTGTTIAKNGRINLKLTLTFSNAIAQLPSTSYTVSGITASLIFVQANAS